MALQPAAQQGQVAQHVTDLVTQEFVGEPQSVVGHAFVVQNDRVVQRCPLGEAARMQFLRVGKETEGARRSDVGPEIGSEAVE